MKLRNKMTGEIVESFEFGIQVELNNSRKLACYSTLQELNEEWEDYKPTEPLIEDKDIRNRLRKWIEVIGISLDTHLTRVQSGDYGLIIESGDNRIAFRYYKKLLYRRKTRKTDLVTMRELIGEEE